ncbi:hypothetical protein PGQ11_010168 [Apiospora arundinis]|uniref:2EXR domain-containing protein n=1 Tax=Apiospora arundinis TaxID=335852 RepID=A0ABR2I8V8_9PEZI
MATIVANTSHNRTTMATPDFHQFSRFPPEIRRAIWREAALTAYSDRRLVLGDRQHQLLTQMHNGQSGLKPSIHVTPRMKPSAIFLTNRESRQVARSIYNVRLHVYDTVADYDSFNGCEAPSYSNGDVRDVVYKGEVYISLVHDIFVTLDDRDLRDNPPEDWEELDTEYWMQYKITGRLSDDQIDSIERIMIVYWLGTSVADEDVGWPPDIKKAIIDNFDKRDDYNEFKEMFKGARSRWDLVDFYLPFYGDVDNILNLPTVTLLQVYLGHYRFSKPSLPSPIDPDNSDNRSSDSGYDSDDSNL